MLSALCAAGCAVHPMSDVTAFAERSGANSFDLRGRKLEPSQTLVLPVVHDPQNEGPSCGAHALASVVNYWNGPDTLSGAALFRESPPADPGGYSMAELLTLAREHGLQASAVRLSEDAVIRELESGRLVLAPVRLPSIYVQQRTLPGGGVPIVGAARNAIINRAGRASEMTGFAMVDHYVLLAGYEGDTFVVVEPVMGYRTISAGTLERYRRSFGDAAIVFSAFSSIAEPGARAR
jgi:hypothetical protein